MPSHTFTRVGLWKESIETNRRSAEAARKEKATSEELHAMDYQTYGYLQIARDSDARRMVDEAQAAGARLDVNATGVAAPGTAGVYATAAIPARYALERGAWAEAAALPARQSTLPYADAVIHFARALGAARSGNPKAAAGDIEKLGALRDALKASQDAYWTEQVEIQRQIAVAWVTFAEGDRARGIELLRAAAQAEDGTDKSAISPGPLAPARELLGDMLLEAGRPAEALKEFEATTKKEPNRFRGLYGAGRAAEAAGQRARAVQFYKQLLQVASEPDTKRPELEHARSSIR
jgi:tetratricopeptide (TPR) repeat protein